MAGGSAAVSEVLVGLASLAIRQRDRELSLTAVGTLATLERSGPRRLTDLAVCEGVTQPSMTAVVSQLQGLGLAERRRDAHDGRVTLVAITQAGRRDLRELRRAAASTLDVLIDKLPEPEADRLDAALPALRHLLEMAEERKDLARADKPASPGDR